MKLSLVVLSEGKGNGQTIPIALSQFIIGRDPQCQLRPSSALISKRHCALISRNGKHFIRDFDSTNGTFLNDEPVKGERELKHEDILKAGPLLFRVAIEGSVAVNKPTPLPKTLDKPDNDDDSVAAMLLDLADEGGSTPNKGADGVPDGTTMMEIPSPFAKAPGDVKPPETATGDPKADAKALAEKKKKEKDTANTSEAARAILEKYTKRQRG
jgi:pSer/pThr/pTyr-binding forkhead associated (FHA) protein